MLLERFFEDSLAQVSYLVGCQATGQALVVDPCRDVDLYIAAAEREELDIVGAVETHIHADYVSGVRELGHRTGAAMHLPGDGPDEWRYGFADEENARLLHDGDEIRVGNVRLRVLHTPGHTPEHASFLLTDGAATDEPMGIFSGDFLFVGDVGRPDLLEKAAGVRDTMEAAARDLFGSLERLEGLPDHLQVWPGHGAGSACGKAPGSVPQSTLGYERLVNWALQIEDQDRFVEAVLQGQPEVPAYFAHMKRINKEGPEVLGTLPRPARLEPGRLPGILDAGGVVVDLRPGAAFDAGHVPGVLSIPAESSFTNWAGSLLPYDREIHLLVGDDEDLLARRVRELALIGLDRVAGWFGADALEAWITAGRELQGSESLTPREVEAAREDGLVEIVDVRARSEWDEGHLPGARRVHLGELPSRARDLPRDRPVVLYCRTGLRSGIGQSILQARGFGTATNLEGGYQAWVARGLPVETGPDDGPEG